MPQPPDIAEFAAIHYLGLKALRQKIDNEIDHFAGELAQNLTVQLKPDAMKRIVELLSSHAGNGDTSGVPVEEILIHPYPGISPVPPAPKKRIGRPPKGSTTRVQPTQPAGKPATQPRKPHPARVAAVKQQKDDYTRIRNREYQRALHNSRSAYAVKHNLTVSDVKKNYSVVGRKEAVKAANKVTRENYREFDRPPGTAYTEAPTITMSAGEGNNE